MQEIKFQIFISSTYMDLKEERDQVIKACLEMGHIPVGMEMFSAADEEQWKIITRQIDQSDYYVILIAQRYGSVVDEISYTEKEYDYAIQQGIPVLGFILSDTANWPFDRVETSNRDLLSSFKEKVMRKPVKWWSTKEELYGQCSIALMKTFNTQPRPGWVRTPTTIGPEITLELSRLSSENARLRDEIVELKKDADVSNFAQGEDEVEIRFLHHFESGNKVFTLSTTWNELFFIIARAILRGPEESALKKAIVRGFSTELENDRQQYKDHIILALGAPSSSISISSIEAVKTQFIALGLIRIDYIGFDTKTGIVWKLTTKGERSYTSLAATRRTI